jgi:ankyrin repeat protein
MDVIKKFILNSSKGLAEVTTSKLPKVQFIHESVRDFLLKENGLSNIWSELGRNLESQGNDRLKECCLSYMGMDIFTPLKIPESLPKASSKEAASLRISIIKAFPFLEYAVYNTLHHADEAERSGIDQAVFLHDFPLLQWVKLNNLFEKHEVRRHTESVSLLYVLAKCNMPNLIRIHPLVHLCLELEDERYGPPLFAAIASGSKEAVRVFEEALGAHSENKDARHVASLDFNYSKRRGIFSCTAELGNVAVLAHLLDSGRFDISAKDPRGRTPLWWASKSGCEAVVKLLLNMDTVEVDTKDMKGETPLYVAVEKGNISVVKLLVKKGADVNAQGGHYGNALYAAAIQGNKEVVELLVNKGADVNAQGGHYGNALYAAVIQGHKEVVELLVNKGADVNAQGGHYGNALQAAAIQGNKEVAELLVNKGADVNAQGGVYDNALQAAQAYGHKEVVELLVNKGTAMVKKGMGNC